jgi:hypothetical protein
MLDENKHIDSLFADGLKGMSVEPNPKVWNSISNNLIAARRKKRGVIIFISTALAASVLLLFGIANRHLFISEPGNFPMEQISDNVSPANNPDNSQNIVATEKEPEQTVTLGMNKETDEVLIASNESLPIEDLSKNISIKNKISFTKESLVNSISLSWRELLNSANQIPKSLQYQRPKKSEPIRLTADELIIKNNLLAMEQAAKENVKKNRWAIIGQLSSAYSNEESATTNNSGIVSFGGGVKVNYALGEKLALQTGFMYNSFGQDLGRANQTLTFSDANVLEGEVKNDFGASRSRSVLPLNTEAGNIKYKGVSNDAVESRLVSNLGSSEELKQNFETIEVPFLLRYSLSQKRLGVYVSGGFGANWLIDNGVYQTSGAKRKIGEIENLRTTNFSSLFGFGIEYQLSPKIQIGLEPSFKYYLNSINKSSEFNYKPYSIGVHTGIRYNF